MPKLFINISEAVKKRLGVHAKKLGMTEEELGAKGIELMVRTKDIQDKPKQGNNTDEE